MTTLCIDDITAAAERIAPYVLRTPTLEYQLHDSCTLFCKAESLQPVGAFKLRGAFNMMLTLPPDCPGVVAHSSGNHAQAVARVAKTLGIPATVVMPSDAPALKIERTRNDGAEVILVGSDSDEREQKAEQLVQARGLTPVPPFDHPLIAAGQGTAALELIEDAAALDQFYAPCSGGGLMAGCATAVANRLPDCAIVGVEPEAANDTQLSLHIGTRQKIDPPETIADGLRVRTPGAFTWQVIQPLLSAVTLVSDAEIMSAMRWAMRELRLVLEPSGAASLAAALRDGSGRCGVLLSGGNVNPTLWKVVCEESVD